jgi:RNA polymerase sigma-70 factor, ECF subfamily
MSNDRAQLIQSLCQSGQGDRRAFEDVYRRTSAKLFGICLRIFNDRQEAEDTLQDAYVTIWNKAAAFDPDRASPITWLATITRNRAIDRLRARKTAGFADLDEAAHVADPSELADGQMISVESDHRLHGCIGALDPKDATFIRSAFLKGTTYADLAHHSNEPLGTVKSRIRRALMKLKLCLGGER